ncbi:MAG: hypothetical protein JNJ45_12355 [Chthonomonas sp.]|nr:hypothetical protein [Chthonomonas sp.]
MNRFRFAAPNFQLDANFRAGQVFRWRRDESGVWHGYEAGHAVKIWRETDTLEVESTLSEDATTAFLALETSADHLGHVPEIAHYLPAYRGMVILRPADPVESLFSFLCASNSNIRRIEQMVASLAGLSSTPPHFPTIEQIASTSEAHLREIGLGYRARTIPLAAQELLRRGATQYLLDLRQASYEHAYAELLSLPGVGPKLADCIAIYALHQREAFPMDVHVWRAMTHTFRPELRDQPLTDRLRREIATDMRARFGPDTMLVQHVLFHMSLTGAITASA